MHDWFAELALDPEVSWLRMGTRALGDRPWLVRDERVEEELALKARLLAERRDEALCVGAGSEAAGREVLALITEATGAEPPAGEHPLGEALHDEDRRAAFSRYVQRADPADRGMPPAQVAELHRALDRI